MAETIKATRMELLRLKKKIKLAAKGHKLLKQKRDALVAEFFQLVDDLKTKRKDVEEQLKISYRSLVLAQAVSGYNEIELSADSMEMALEIKPGQRAVMGVKVPVFEIEEKGSRRGYSLLSPTIELDTAVKNFEEALKNIIKLAEVETTAVKLADEIKKTKRKVNALEQIVIPRLKGDVRTIRMRLEEMERESFVRLKVIKANMSE